MITETKINLHHYSTVYLFHFMPTFYDKYFADTLLINNEDLSFTSQQSF